jgi:hypothetical protein
MARYPTKAIVNPRKYGNHDPDRHPWKGRNRRRLRRF